MTTRDNMLPGVKPKGPKGRNGHCPVCGLALDVGKHHDACTAAYESWWFTLPMGDPIIPRAR